MSGQTDSQDTQDGGSGKKPIDLSVASHPEPETTDMGRGDPLGAGTCANKRQSKHIPTHHEPEDDLD